MKIIEVGMEQWQGEGFPLTLILSRVGERRRVRDLPYWFFPLPFEGEGPRVRVRPGKSLFPIPLSLLRERPGEGETGQDKSTR
jgi:hypothetical protein